jgi:hypothetical protein
MSKITPIPIDEPVSIPEGYELLSPQAFSVWVRLMVATEKERTGYQALSKMLGFSRVYTHKIIKELKLGGFIKIVKTKKRKRVKVVIRKRIVISGQNSFVRLS